MRSEDVILVEGGVTYVRVIDDLDEPRGWHGTDRCRWQVFSKSGNLPRVLLCEGYTGTAGDCVAACRRFMDGR